MPMHMIVCNNLCFMIRQRKSYATFVYIFSYSDKHTMQPFLSVDSAELLVVHVALFGICFI